jgi:hypothetical protein
MLRSRLVKLGHDIGDRLANSGDFSKRPCRDHTPERLRKGGTAVSRCCISLRGRDTRHAERPDARIP